VKHAHKVREVSNNNGYEAKSNAINTTFHNKNKQQGQRTMFNHTNRKKK